jgi:hypothetical protein
VPDITDARCNREAQFSFTSRRKPDIMSVSQVLMNVSDEPVNEPAASIFRENLNFLDTNFSNQKFRNCPVNFS